MSQEHSAETNAASREASPPERSQSGGQSHPSAGSPAGRLPTLTNLDGAAEGSPPLESSRGPASPSGLTDVLTSKKSGILKTDALSPRSALRKLSFKEREAATSSRKRQGPAKSASFAQNLVAGTARSRTFVTARNTMPMQRMPLPPRCYGQFGAKHRSDHPLGGFNVSVFTVVPRCALYQGHEVHKAAHVSERAKNDCVADIPEDFIKALDTAHKIPSCSSVLNDLKPSCLQGSTFADRYDWEPVKANYYKSQSSMMIGKTMDSMNSGWAEGPMVVSQTSFAFRG